MFHTEQVNGRWTLSLDGLPMLVHTAKQPFITAVRHDRTYKTARGSMKGPALRGDRLPLPEIRMTSPDTIVFSASGHRVTATLTEHPGGVLLTLSGEAGWAYELRLPAIEGEAVFGGGEQYREMNLRGESVVSFVADRTNVSTILQKAAPPRLLYRDKMRRSIGSCAPMPVFVTDRLRLILFETTADGFACFGDDVYLFSFDRCPNALLHNEWPMLWAKLNREAIEEYGKDDVFFFMRSGHLGVQAYAPMLWNGDLHTDYIELFRETGAKYNLLGRNK